ncbi:MAG: dienelactone hydrolase family protein [Phycisphaeraceae bacterium]
MRHAHSIARVVQLLCTALALTLLVAAASAQGPDAPPPKSDKPAPRQAAESTEPFPQAPGHHRLHFPVRIGERQLDLPYVLSVPKNYQQPRQKKPLLIFLVGAGERGNDHQGIFVHGPSAEMQRNRELEDQVDMLVLSPQIPGDLSFDQPEVAGAIVQLMVHVAGHWRIDTTRVYATGLSMGGKGCWQLAATAPPRTFAAIVPICARALDSEQLIPSLAGTAVWIISGGADGDFTTDARKMTEALRNRKVDVTHTEVPNEGHGVWLKYYPRIEFYDWLLCHQRGKPARARPSDEQLLKMATAAPESGADRFNRHLTEELGKFLPYWQILNCGRDMEPGMRDRFGSRTKVFVTHPLNGETPCVLMTTAAIPAKGKTSLRLIVGHHPEGDWDLIVRADGHELLRQNIGKDTARNGWRDISIDLTSYAGKDVRLELLNQPTGWSYEAGYWGAVVIRTTP